MITCLIFSDQGKQTCHTINNFNKNVPAKLIGNNHTPYISPETVCKKTKSLNLNMKEMKSILVSFLKFNFDRFRYNLRPQIINFNL